MTIELTPANVRELAQQLSIFHRKVVARTSDRLRPPPDVNWRRVSPATMRLLRDKYEVVEDGFGLWRRTDLGRAVAQALEE